MVRHDNKLMQKILFLCSVIHHDFNEEPGNLLHLEEAFSVKHIGSDKICGFSCSSSMRNRQKVTSAAKAEILQQLYRSPAPPVEPETIAAPCGTAGLSCLQNINFPQIYVVLSTVVHFM